MALQKGSNLQDLKSILLNKCLKIRPYINIDKDIHQLLDIFSFLSSKMLELTAAVPEN